MKPLLLALSTLIIISGCASYSTGSFKKPITKNVMLKTKFDPKAASYVLEDGTATVTGSASITGSLGETINCAGNNVYMAPVTEYSTERYLYLFGEIENDFASDEVIHHVRFKSDSPAFRKHMRVTTCNYVGEFTFHNIAAGDYYIGTNIISELEGYNTIQGGALAKKISVKSGETLKVKLD